MYHIIKYVTRSCVKIKTKKNDLMRSEFLIFTLTKFTNT
jgi:hypothetical protein